MAEELNLDRDWEFEINLSGIEAPTGKKAMSLPKGYYMVTITDMYINQDKNPNRYVIKGTVAEGAFKGAFVTDGISKVKSPEDNVRYYWRALAESVGFTPAQLDSGSLRLNKDSFIGKVGHILYTPKNPEAAKGAPDAYETVVWLSRSTWLAQKGAGDASEEMSSNGASASAASILDAIGRAANA